MSLHLDYHQDNVEISGIKGGWPFWALYLQILSFCLQCYPKFKKKKTQCNDKNMVLLRMKVYLSLLHFLTKFFKI